VFIGFDAEVVVSQDESCGRSKERGEKEVEGGEQEGDGEADGECIKWDHHVGGADESDEADQHPEDGDRP
jgi:hypothetical protein